MGVGLCKGRDYENGGGTQELLGGVTPSLFQAGSHLERDDSGKRLTLHPDLAWCRDGRGGRRCRSGAPSASTA